MELDGDSVVEFSGDFPEVEVVQSFNLKTSEEH